MVCMLSPLLSVWLVICPTGLITAVTMVRDVIMMNGVQAGEVNDDIAVIAIEDITVIVTRDIEAVVVTVNHVKKEDIAVVIAGTVVAEIVVDIVAVAVAVRVVISHTAVHTKTGGNTVNVVVVISRVDQGQIEMTVDPSANAGPMRKEQTMNAGPVGRERTVVQRTRETVIAMKRGHSKISVRVTAITARPQQMPRVLVLQLSVFALGFGGIWRPNVPRRAGTRVRMPECVVFRMRVPVPSVKPHPRKYYLRILSQGNLLLRV